MLAGMRTLAGTMLIVQILSAPSWAQDFRVETDVFVGDETQPVAETLTLFFGDVVYDFILSEPREITVFDVRRNRLHLLDPQREVRTLLTTQELIEFSAALEVRANAELENPLFSTTFQLEEDEKSGELVLLGNNLNYRASGEAHGDSEQRRRFYEFASWYARLNALRPGTPPPFARLELNRQLAQRQLLPTQIARTLTLPGTFRDVQQVARSRHAFTWTLSTTDRKRIEDAGNYMANFTSVTLAKYLALPRVAASDQ